MTLADHYYSHKPDVESNPKFWDYTLRGRTFRFKSDNGVFSKDTVDFGSRLLIETFTLDEELPGDILDAGCGYGPIGLALAASYPDKQIQMVDVNSRAVQLAKENAELNGLSNVTIFESDSFENVTSNQLAAVLTNPPIRAGKKVVHQILQEGYDHLARGGSLWAVIQKKQGAPSAMKLMEELFGNVEVAEKSKGYFILTAKKV